MGSASTAGTRATFSGSGRAVNLGGRSSNSAFARALNRLPGSAFRNGRLTASAQRRLRSRG